MSINCKIVVRNQATADELTALGRTLWRWYSRAWRDPVLCQTVDNQGLADLLGGKPPGLHRTPQFAGRRFVHLRVPDDAYPDARATADGLRQALGAERVEEIWVDGKRGEVGADRGSPAPDALSATTPSRVRS